MKGYRPVGAETSEGKVPPDVEIGAIRKTNREDSGNIVITLSEYKELLIIKGKYEELSKKEQPIIWNPPPIQPLTVPYPQDLTPKYPSVTLCNCEIEKRADGSFGVVHRKTEEIL